MGLLVTGCARAGVLRHALVVRQGQPSLPGDARRREYRTCPRCTAPLRWEDARCDVCLWPAAEDGQERPAKAFEAIHRTLYRFHALGVISQASFEELLKTTRSMLVAEPAAKKSLAPKTPPPPEQSQPAPDAMRTALPNPLADVQPRPAAPIGPVAPREPVRESPRKPEPVASRVAGYAARREEAARQAAAATPPPPKEKRDWGKVFAGFMQEHNIMWGELVGGLMIVGCSIALVISFWSQIADRPLLKYGLFNGVSAALFAAGFYTDRRWKIHTTSHGVLIIATLLVPLNFLAIAAFTNASGPADLLTLGGEAFSLILFTALTYLAGKIITPHTPWALAAGVMIPSLMQLLIRRFASPEASIGLLVGLASVPLASFAGAVLWSLKSARGDGDKPSLNNALARHHLILLGLCLFATLLPLGLLLQKGGDVSGALQRLAPLLVVLGGPLLATALVFLRRLADESTALRVASGSVGVLGGLMLLASLGLSWPLPAALVAAGLINAVLWIGLARGAKLPMLLTVAAACLAVAWVVGGATWAGGIAWTTLDAAALVKEVFSAPTGARLAPLVLLFSALAVGARSFWPESFAAWGYSAGGAAAGSMGLLLLFGFGRLGDPAGATWYFALYAALLTAAAAWLNHRDLSWGAAAILVVAILQGVLFRYGTGWGDVSSWARALLGFATLAAGLASVFAAGARFRWPDRTAEFRQALGMASLGASVLTAGLLCALGSRLPYLELAADFMWLAIVWLALTWLLNNAGLFIAFQLAVAAALAVTVTAGLAKSAWFDKSPLPWLDPWFLQAQAIALALLGIFWRALRFAWGLRGKQSDTSEALTIPPLPWTLFDRGAAITVFALTLALCAYAVFPGMRQELSPSVEQAERVPAPIAQLALTNIPLAHAAGWGAWGLLAATVVLVAIGCWDCRPSLRLLGLFALGAAGCLLAAAVFTDQTAAASATRWILGGYALFAAIPVIARRQTSARLAALGVHLDPVPAFIADSRASAGRSAVVGLIVLLYLAIAGIVALTSLRLDELPPGAGAMLWWCGGLALLAAIAWLAVSTATAQEPTDQPNSKWSTLGRNLLGLAGIAPLTVVSAFVVASSLTRRPLVGPDPDSWFGGLGQSVLYGVPLLMLAVVLLAFAVRERSSRYALSFGLLMNGIATLVYLLQLAAAGRQLDAVAWIEVAQLNAAVAALTSLGWWGAIARQSGAARASERSPVLLVVLAALGATFAAETLVAGCWGVFEAPANLTWQPLVASPAGLLAVGLAAVALWLTTRPNSLALTPHHLGGLGVVAVGLSTAIAARIDDGGWQAYHTMLVVSALAGWAMVWAPAAWRSIAWAIVFAALTSLFALRELSTGKTAPNWPWWSLAGLLSVYGVLLSIAWHNRRRWPVWLSAPVLALAGNVWWWNLTTMGARERFLDFLYSNVVFVSLAAIVSVIIEHAWRRTTDDNSPPSHRILGLHRAAVWVGLTVLLLAVVIDLFEGSAKDTWWVGYMALGALLTAIVASLWDPHVRWPVPAFYCLGLAAVGRYLGSLDLKEQLFTWAFTLALSAFVLATSYLWERRAAIAGTAIRLGAPAHLHERLDSQVWMLGANGVAILVVLLGVVAVLLGNEVFSHRMTGAYGVLACALGLAFMASGRVETVLRYLALAAGAAFAVAFAWAWIPPSLPAAEMNRLVAAAVALAAVIPLYSTVLVKFWKKANPWTLAAQRTIPTLVALAGGLLVVTLAAEVFYFTDGQSIPLAWPAILAVALALAALVISSLAAALIPGRDPLGLTERGRTAYVYAAEVFLGLLFLHVRVTMPWLFTGFFARFWPFIVMLIAFGGVGLSEWFARRKRTVLSEPLGNTGVFLPLLPVIGYWSASQSGQYALLLCAVGAVYDARADAQVGPVRRRRGAGVQRRVVDHARLGRGARPVEPPAVLAHPAGGVRAGRGGAEPLAVGQGFAQRRALRLGADDLRRQHGGHLHQRR